LKIDRSFVSSSQDSQGRALLHTMVSLGRSMGVETVAEGIEQEAELRILQAEGCSTGQGYLLASPMGKDVLWSRLTRAPVPAGVEVPLRPLSRVRPARPRCPRPPRQARRSG
jgi:EAL domain-containing protein (putative c-di-GMP-specific phosphodiesterase class I)